MIFNLIKVTLTIKSIENRMHCMALIKGASKEEKKTGPFDHNC
jgi:6-phosphogluconolactonase/glucosamine-6-phosphate isomerase/deaminase